MVSGDLTASTPIECVGLTAVKTAIDTLNLALVTDFIMCVSIAGRDGCYLVFKVQRAA